MNNNDWQNLKGLGVLFSTGMTMAAAVVVGYFLGSYIDGKLHTSPWFTILLLFVGVGAGFKTIYDSMFPENKGGNGDS